MAKKLVIDNPALNYITTPAEQEQEQESKTLQIEQKAPASIPNGYRVVYLEKRTERIQLLVPPSLKDKLKAKAEKEGTSVNDIINSLLQEHL